MSDEGACRELDGVCGLVGRGIYLLAAGMDGEAWHAGECCWGRVRVQ